MSGWRRLMNGLLDVLYPHPDPCALCTRPVRKTSPGGDTEGAGLLCSLCEREFAFIVGEVCDICGRPWIAGETCGDCLRRKEQHFLHSRSAVRYNEPMKELLARYKYRGDRALAEVMVFFLHRAWQRHYAEINIDCLTYIPLHEARLFERTFNQAEEMARLLGEEVGVPVYGLLERKKATEKQSQQSRAGRLHALDNVFGFAPSDELAMPERPVIVLIDDVYTTGTTMTQAGQAIKKGIPGAKIYGLTVAR